MAVQRRTLHAQSEDPIAKDKRMDEAHKAANGKRFELKKRMYLNGRLIYPGELDGRRCGFRHVLRGING
jgi:hypothetical protein